MISSNVVIRVVGRINRVVTDGSVQDVRICLREILKNALVNATILESDVHRRVQNPVINNERSANFVKVTIIEGKEVLVLVIQPLDCVRDILREVSNIAWKRFRNLIGSIRINRRDRDSASVKEAPFHDSVPVGFPNGAFMQVLLRCCNVG